MNLQKDFRIVFRNQFLVFSKIVSEIVIAIKKGIFALSKCINKENEYPNKNSGFRHV